MILRDKSFDESKGFEQGACNKVSQDEQRFLNDIL